MPITIPREILAIKVATTRPPGVDTPIVSAALRQSIAEGIYKYLCSNPRCTEDAARYWSNTVTLQASASASPTFSSANQASDRPGGPEHPIPPNIGRCHDIHAYTAAQDDPKIKNIELMPGPSETWNAGTGRTNSLHHFLHIMKPLTTLLEGVFKVTNPNAYEICNKVYQALPKNTANKGIKDCLGIWTSRSLVLDTMSDIQLDLKHVCKGFCAIVPFGPFQGVNFCLPRLGISIQVAPGML